MIPWIDMVNPVFPSVEQALTDPNGLLCAGGNLDISTLHSAYQQGIFPWPVEDYPLLWWSPDPRMVLTPESFHLSRRLKRFLHNINWQVKTDLQFERVILACAEIPRFEQQGSWITEEILEAYMHFHDAGFAHSIEVYDDHGVLCGGLYGVALGRIFFGESMFSKAANASKVALAYLMHSGCYDLVDCQMSTSHLESLGGYTIKRADFLRRVKELTDQPARDLREAISQVIFR